VETVTEQRASKQVPPEASGVEHSTLEERRVPKPRQEAPEQSVATPSTQEGVLPDAVAWGKTPMVVARPESSQRQEETEAG
jgi:hypothetical protein